VTGTFAIAIQSYGSASTYVTTYTINSANTWETKSVTFPKTTTGTWAADNGATINLIWDLGGGSDFNTTANTWTSGNYYTVTGTTKLVSTTNATFYITGVQLEKGTQATSFDFRSIGTELALCQRYYVPLGGNLVGMLNGSGTAQGFVFLPVAPRSTPSVSYTGTANMVAFGVGTYASTTQPSGIAWTANSNNLHFAITGFGTTPTTGSGQLANVTYIASMEL
jgi:hypothetical protein